jgi:hypothetical protein
MCFRGIELIDLGLSLSHKVALITSDVDAHQDIHPERRFAGHSGTLYHPKDRW